MEKEQLPAIVKSIRSDTSKSKLYHNLKLLRRIVDDKSKFTAVQESGALRLILNFIPNNTLEIVDIILSIVGNCCIDRGCAKEVVKYQGIRLMCDVLKKWKVDSVICRVFRILGNIAQFENYASEIYKYDIVTVIVNHLKKATINKDDSNEKEKLGKKPTEVSMDTEVTAVRALRLLWQSYSSRQSMIRDGVVQAVSMVLIKNTQKWLKNDDPEPLRKRREKLLESVLKCLLLYTNWVTLDCAQQMLADGTGFKSLVALIDLFPYSAVKCVTNLSPVAKSRSAIDISAAVQRIVEKMKYYVDKKPNRGCPSEIVNAFCLFSRHPLNCIEVKKAGGLPLILEVLKNCRSKRQEFQIVQALPGFLNDEASQEILVVNGVVNIIVDCLERNLKSKLPLTETHTYIKYKRTKTELHLDLFSSSKKRSKMDISMREKNEFVTKSPVLSDLYSKMNMLTGQDILAGCLTPSDSESSPLSSPSCTPPRKYDEAEDDDDSVNYSPVCSDTDDLDGTGDCANELSSVLLSPQLCDESDEDCESERVHFESSDMQEKAVIIMLIVLSRILHIKPYPSDLRENRTIETLLKYFRESKYPKGRITSILMQIVSNVDNLMSFILSDTIFVIHSLTQLQHDSTCAKCVRMKNVAISLLKEVMEVASSEKGRVIFFEQMTNDDLDIKKKCAMTAPYVVKIKPFLQNLMDNYGGLSILLNQFLNDHEERYRTLGALSQLARSVNINNPCIEKLPNKTLKISENFEFDKKGKNLIVIKLDDGQNVVADRDFLIENGEYFKAMLSGSFREAEQDSIRLKNVSYEALNCLLFLLALDVKKIEPCLLKVDLSVLLEVIILTDSYLLEGLTEWLTSCVECYMINISSASEIYKWSIESGTNFLRVETAAFILTGKMKDSERYHLCEKIVENEFMSQLHDDFHELIFRYLKIR